MESFIKKYNKEKVVFNWERVHLLNDRGDVLPGPYVAETSCSHILEILLH